MTKLHVAKVVTWAASEGIGRSIDRFGGFFEDGMRWQDYERECQEKNHPHNDALRDWILHDRIWIDGSTHQHDTVPVFSDGTCATFSYRAWGDLMAAVWSTELDANFSYLDFYFSVPEPHYQARVEGQDEGAFVPTQIQMSQIYRAVVRLQKTKFPESDFRGKTNHLKREVIELQESGGDLGEFADCLILLLGALWSCGHETVDKLLIATEQKIHLNMERDWGGPDADGVIEHATAVPAGEEKKT